MSNPRMTKKDLGLIKGSLRRVFSRSDLRKKVVCAARIEHIDTERPRVRRWSRCKICQKPEAEYQIQVDHRNPVVPIEKSLDSMSLDELADNIWCEEEYLDILCKPCHNIKTKAENKQRRLFKKEKKDESR